jgi:hypothetical protein
MNSFTLGHSLLPLLDGGKDDERDRRPVDRSSNKG